MKNSGLFIKSLVGFLFLLVIMGAALFLSYGSLHYLLAWIYLAIFFIPVLAITLYLFLSNKKLLKSRLSAGPGAEQRASQKVIQSAAGLVFIIIYVLSALDYRHQWSEVPVLLNYLGDIVCFLVLIFLFFVYKQNTYLSATIEVQNNQQVIANGFYGIIRHPMYAGVMVLMIFTPVALGSFWGLIPSLILTVIILFRAFDEEKELKQNLEGYEEYCKKVKPRIIPFLF